MMEKNNEGLYISTIALAEIWRGVLDLPASRKHRVLEDWFNGPEGPPALFANRILPFNAKASFIWARLMSEGTKKGRPRSPMDMMVASIAEANDCILVTDNEKHFAGLKFINPLRAMK